MGSAVIVKRVIACLAIGILLAGCASDALRSEAPMKSSSGTSSSGTPTQTAPPCCIPSTKATPSPPTNFSAKLSVSSTRLSVGQPMTVNGSDCPAGQWVGVSLDESERANHTRTLPLGPYSFFAGGPQPVPVGADGQWTTTSTVPMLPGGPTMLTAYCGPEAGGPTAWLFVYPSVPVTVTTPFRLSVLPSTTVSPGTTLSVTPIGGGCPAPADSWLGLYSTSQPPARPQIQVAEGEVNNTGLSADQTRLDWTGSLTVPSSLAPGQYRLEADCVYARGAPRGSYAPIAITVK
jgi:hypothetical protein